MTYVISVLFCVLGLTCGRRRSWNIRGDILELPKRKNMRLKDYDYSQNGAYFLTVCVENRNELLSEIRRGDPCGRPNG